jgi:hypothetical protein
MARSRSRVIGWSGASRPPEAVITRTPETPAGGLENRVAYASLPRKYRPLTKLNTSPSVAWEDLSLWLSSDLDVSRSNDFPRTPDRFAGESRKMVSRVSARGTIDMGRDGLWPRNEMRFSDTCLEYANREIFFLRELRDRKRAYLES